VWGQLSDISFTLRPGECLAFCRPSRLRRQQLAKALFGLLPSDRGEIRLDGKPLVTSQPLDAIDAGTATCRRTADGGACFLTQSVARNISVGRVGAYRGCSAGWTDQGSPVRRAMVQR